MIENNALQIVFALAKNESRNAKWEAVKALSKIQVDEKVTSLFSDEDIQVVFLLLTSEDSLTRHMAITSCRKLLENAEYSGMLLRFNGLERTADLLREQDLQDIRGIVELALTKIEGNSSLFPLSSTATLFFFAKQKNANVQKKLAEAFSHMTRTVEDSRIEEFLDENLIERLLVYCNYEDLDFFIYSSEIISNLSSRGNLAIIIIIIIIIITTTTITMHFLWISPDSTPRFLKTEIFRPRLMQLGALDILQKLTAPNLFKVDRNVVHALLNFSNTGKQSQAKAWDS